MCKWRLNMSERICYRSSDSENVSYDADATAAKRQKRMCFV